MTFGHGHVTIHRDDVVLKGTIRNLLNSLYLERGNAFSIQKHPALSCYIQRTEKM